MYANQEDGADSFSWATSQEACKTFAPQEMKRSHPIAEADTSIGFKQIFRRIEASTPNNPTSTPTVEYRSFSTGGA